MLSLERKFLQTTSKQNNIFIPSSASSVGSQSFEYSDSTVSTVDSSFSLSKVEVIKERHNNLEVVPVEFRFIEFDKRSHPFVEKLQQHLGLFSKVPVLRVNDRQFMDRAAVEFRAKDLAIEEQQERRRERAAAESAIKGGYSHFKSERKKKLIPRRYVVNHDFKRKNSKNGLSCHAWAENVSTMIEPKDASHSYDIKEIMNASELAVIDEFCPSELKTINRLNDNTPASSIISSRTGQSKIASSMVANKGSDDTAKDSQRERFNQLSKIPTPTLLGLSYRQSSEKRNIQLTHLLNTFLT